MKRRYKRHFMGKISTIFVAQVVLTQKLVAILKKTNAIKEYYFDKLKYHSPYCEAI